MVRREPPQTEEGWYALHDFRTIDWAAWRDAPERVRERAVEEAASFLQSAEAVADADEGDSAVYSILGDGADLMIVHLRPPTADLDVLERQFERTELARFTERSYSYVSVTEASGYTERAREYFDGEVDDDSGLAKYIRSRLHPEIPDSEHVSFYPMSKRRDAEYNWYDLPLEERAEHMDSHGDIGRDYAGKVQQMITGSVGLDDWEWGVTLWADDLTDVKDLLYEMRFDPSTAKFAEFGPFYVGRRFPPADLGAYLAGEAVPTDSDEASGITAASATGSTDGARPKHASENGHAHGDASEATPEREAANGGSPSQHGQHAGGGSEASRDVGSAGGGGGHGDDSDSSGGGHGGGSPPVAGQQEVPDGVEEYDDVERRLADFGVYPESYDDGDYGLVFYATTQAEDLVDDVEGLRENFEHYDTHVLTSVRANSGEAAVVSVWENERAATTAAGFLSDLPGVSQGARGPLGEANATADEADGAGDSADGAADDDIRGELADMDIYAGQPHGEDVYALVLYSQADREELFAEVDDLRDGFDRYDTHVKTAVYEDPDSETTAVVSLWDTQSAADTAADFLADLPGIVGRAQDREGFGTMGMFYTVQPEHREEFVDTFGTVGDLLTEMDGHRETALLVNREDENDMFIASQWDAKEDAMAFFRSDEFRETVEWGREVLADRPRHVFLA